MKRDPVAPRHGPFIDLGYSSLKVLTARGGLELPLERHVGGPLTAACRQRVLESLRKFFNYRGESRWRQRAPALCALPASGVSLRAVDMPGVAPEEVEDLLLLQVEKEFPLPPERLAWGYLKGAAGNGIAAATGPATAPPMATWTLAGLRDDPLGEYATLLSECGLQPTFSLGALASRRLCPAGKEITALLDVGKKHSELLLLHEGRPLLLRSVPWGGDDLTRALSQSTGVSFDEAENRKCAGMDAESGAEPTSETLPQLTASVETLARRLQELWQTQGQAVTSGDTTAAPERLFLVGGGARFAGLEPLLRKALAGKIPCQRIDTATEPGCSAVTLGLRGGNVNPEAPALLHLRRPAPPVATVTPQRSPSLRAWAVSTLVLALIAFSLRYVGLLWELPSIRGDIQRYQELRDSIPSVDNQLGFHEYVKAGQTPYLDALAVIARAAPTGTLLGSISMYRRGDISVEGSTASFQSAEKFRSEIVKTRRFSQAIFEDRTPTKEGRSLQFRLRARMRPDAPELPELPEIAKESPTEEEPATAPHAKPGSDEAPHSTEAPPGGTTGNAGRK